jgi:hypothetical protein
MHNQDTGITHFNFSQGAGIFSAILYSVDVRRQSTCSELISSTKALPNVKDSVKENTVNNIFS